MLPARKAGRPASFRMRWSRVVVVDLPLVPVIPTIVPFRNPAVEGGGELGNPGNAGTGDDQIRAEKRGERMSAGFQSHAPADPCLRLGSEGFPGFLFGDCHPGPAAEKKIRRRLARPGQADHQDVFIAKIHGHLNFRVARLNRAKMMPRIQNRTTTFSSGQPRSSK